MDFARKQLEKYGWTDGKGLGKHENGISEALKPKLKRSVTGVGHDPASEFNEHWWSALYDKAAKNVEVKEKDGYTKKIKTKDSDNFVISSSTWKINKKKKNAEEKEYSEYFVKTSVMTGGGRETEDLKSSSESETEDAKKDVLKMTDEELFAACGGRTAHKGARHGLRALGKLARIEQQEQLLLKQAKYRGYSHAEKLKEQIIEETSLDNEQETKRKKKKKKKYCKDDESLGEIEMLNTKCDMEVDVASEKNDSEDGRKSKKKKRKLNEEVSVEIVEETPIEISKRKKKKKTKDL